ncbi:MAG: FtsX-like permease family protein [Rhodocyclaceae bacterium]|nr:FtsX-like permease family protein [Rhodocyclaceae bacterium]
MPTLTLAYRMLRRDLRAGELNLLVLALLIAVASLTSVGFLTDRVAQALNREANQLLGGDLLLRADHPWPEGIAAEARARGLTVVTTTQFVSMTSTAESAQLAGVKAVEAGYPLRGALRTAPAPNQPDAPAVGIPAPGEAWLDERLFAALGIAPGDRVGLGNIELRAAAMVSFESDRGANFFALLPRILINAGDLDATGLIQPGSRITYLLQIAGAAARVDDFRRWVEPQLARGERLESIENARPEVRNALDQAQRFLRLAALLAVILAAVAVGLSARRFMVRHVDGCAVMRCLGAPASRVSRLILFEFMMLGLVVSLLGAAVGWGVQWGLGRLLADLLGALLPPPSLLPLGHGLAVGLALLVGFAGPQLLRLSRVPMLRVLRREWGGVEPATSAAWLTGGVVLVLMLVWIAGDVRLGVLVAGGFGLALGLFALLAWGVLRGLARLRGGPMRGGWRYGVAALTRRMGGSVVQAVALGAGLAALLLLTVIRADLLDTWRRSTPEDAPNRFVINLQPDQAPAFERFFIDNGMAKPDLMPMIRGRLTAINGKPVNPDDYPEGRPRRLAEREFNLSFMAQLPPGNRVTAGQWHGAGAAREWSVEKGIAEVLGIALGDRLEYDVAGERVEATVTSIRTLDWDSMRVNFFVIASPGVLEGRPASLITAFHLPADQHEFTTRLVAGFPNVSIIDVTAVVAQIQAMIDRLIGVVQFVFGFALLAGLVVLWAALQSTHDEREYELAMLRTLGARNGQLRHALLAEFSVLGLVAGVLAGGGATAIGWALGNHAFRLVDYVPSGAAMVVGGLVGALGVMAAGWVGTRGLLSRAPMASLRTLG